MAYGRRFAVLAGLLVLSTACGGEDGKQTTYYSPPPSSPPVGVSFLDYSPKPITKDMTSMTVRFRTRGPADPGLEYTAWLFTGEDGNDQDCWSEFGARDGVRGKAGKTYTQVIELLEREGTHFQDPWHACTGEAKLVVWTQFVDDPGNAVEFLTTRPLEILPPR